MRSFANQLGMPPLPLNMEITAQKIRCNLYDISNEAIAA